MQQCGKEDGANDDGFNLEMATVNPFFNEDSHLPPRFVNNILAENDEKEVECANKSPAVLSEEKETSKATRFNDLCIWKSAFLIRLLVFVVVSIAFLWSFLLDDMIKTYFVPISYMLMSYVLISQGAFTMSIVQDHDKNFVFKSILLALILSIAITIGVNEIPDIVKESSTQYHAMLDMKKCVPFSKAELPICSTFFGEKDTVLATPSITNDGKSLTRRSILKVIAGVHEFKNELLNTEECQLVLDLICQALLSPCDTSCRSSKIATSRCIEKTQQSCINLLSSNNRDLERYNLIFLYKILGDKEHEIYTQLVNQTLIDILNLPQYQTKSSFCRDTTLFASRNISEAYNCTKTMQVKTPTTKKFNLSTILKVTWTCNVLLYFVWLSKYKSFYKKKRKSYTGFKIVEITICLAFILSLFVRTYMSFLLLNNEQDKNSSWDIITFHSFGLTTVAIIYTFVDIALKLKGKEPVSTVTEHENIFSRYYALFEALTNIRDGKYYVQYIVVFEILEIALQVITFDAMARHSDLAYVTVASSIICLNLILTPIGFLILRYNPTLGRNVTYVCDSALETAYFFLNMHYATGKDLLDFSILLSLFIPLFTLLSKVKHFTDYITTYEINQARKDSWLEKSIKNRRLIDISPKKNERCTGRDSQVAVSTNISKQKNIYICYVATASLMILSGCTLFSFMMYRIANVTNKCRLEIGTDIWEGSYPRYVFLNGPFHTPDCHYETIKTVVAEKKGIKLLTESIGKLINVIQFSLPHNDIIDLPLSITALTKAHFDFSNNPIWRTFKWDGKGITIFPRLLEQFKDLEILSLNDNNISAVPSFISKLKQLREFNLANNKISRDGLPIAMTELAPQLGGHLKLLLLENNPVETCLTWHGILHPAAALEILQLLNNTVEDLDLSHGKFTTGNVEYILSQYFSRLIKLNVSNNSMTEFHATTKYGDQLMMLDISNNKALRNMDEDTFKLFAPLWNRGNMYFANLNDNVFYWKYIYYDYPVDMLESYFRSNKMIQVDFLGYKFASLCNLHPELVGLSLDTAYKEVDFECFKRFTQLRVLRLDGVGIFGDNTGKTLGNVLLRTSKLVHLSLTRMQIDDTAMKFVSPAIAKLRDVTHLYMGGNKIGTIGAKNLSVALSNKYSLLTLNLENNRVADKGIKHIMFALNISVELRYLNVGSNTIGDEGAMYIAKYLKNKRKLTSLWVHNNLIGDKGAASLAKHLPKMVSLRSVRLNGNKISESGATLLAAASKKMADLQLMRLEHNNISKVGIKMLRNNTRIKIECKNCDCCAPLGCDDRCQNSHGTKVILGKKCYAGGGVCARSGSNNACCDCNLIC